MPTGPTVEITYCRLCGWGLRAGWMAQELLTTFAAEVGSVALTPDASGGVFEIRVDGDLVWSRKERGRFRAYNVVEVTIRDMGKVGEAVTAATEAGANVMSGPDLRVSNREAANKSAYAAAYRAARSRADAYAEAAGLKVARVLAIYDGGESYAPPPPSYARDAVAQSAAPVAPPPAPFSAGLNTTEVRVRVDFALAD